MSYDNRKELKALIGKVGMFYNNEQEEHILIGTLKAVTRNGSCDDGECYSDEFQPLHRWQADLILDKIFNPTTR